MTLKITSEEMGQIALFEGLTGAHVRDCVINDEANLITFVVKEGEMGLAIGKNGSNIRRAERMVGKSIEVVEYSPEKETFIRNILSPARIKSVKFSEEKGKNVVSVVVEFENKKVAIGRKGRKIENAKKLARRHFEIQDVVLR